MNSAEFIVQDRRHFRNLGTLWVLYGVFRVVAAVWLITFSSTATVMFGALLSRVGDPFTLMSVFHFMYTVVIAWSLCSGVIGVLAGIALLADQQSARILTLTAAILSLSEIPLGLTLGVYSLISFLPLPIRSGHESADLHHEPAGLERHASAS